MKVFENDADWEERAWELAKKLVSIDSSDPGAYEGEIGERLYEYLSRCCERCGGPDPNRTGGGTSGPV